MYIYHKVVLCDPRHGYRGVTNPLVEEPVTDEDKSMANFRIHRYRLPLEFESRNQQEEQASHHDLQQWFT